MNNIKTILVDDEPRGINSLKKILREYWPEVDVIAECADAEIAKEKIELLEPQLVFLDISLPDKSGFDLLQELGKVNFEIIFVTAHNEYTLQAFHYSAIDYLMKPIDEDLLVDAVKRATKKITAPAVNSNVATLLHNLQQIQAPQDMKLCIHSTKGFQVVELKDILYCEASGNYTNFHFNSEHRTCTAKPIHEYEELLADAGFVRIHKSYLINLLHVKEYIRGEGGAVILSNGTQVEVSRRKKDVFISRMKEFYKY